MTFTGIDSAKFGRIKDSVLNKGGIAIISNTGSASAKGVTISWVYSPDTGTLLVNVDKRSWFDPSEDSIEQDITAWIEAA